MDLDFHIIKIDPKYNAQGRAHLVRFGLSFLTEEGEPFHDVVGYLLTNTGIVQPPKTYAQRGQRTHVVQDSDEFLDDLAKLWRTHPDLVDYYNEVAPPEVAGESSFVLQRKDRVAVSLRGLRDVV